MNAFRQLIALTALFSVFTQSVHSQEFYDNQFYESSYDNSSAYNESINITHLTAIIPVVALIGAAICLSTFKESGSSSGASFYSNSSSSYQHSSSGHH